MFVKSSMKTILKHFQEYGIPIYAACNGLGNCGKCKVIVDNRILDITAKERKHLAEKELNNGVRLACCHEYDKNDVYRYSNLSEGIEEGVVILSKLDDTSRSGIGMAIDIGTTTIVLKYFDMKDAKCIRTSSLYNPQASFGSDVIARITFDTNDTKHQLHKALIEVIEQEIYDSRLQINKMVVSANTVMMHTFLDLPLHTLGQIPFTIPQKGSLCFSSKDTFPNLTEFEIVTLPHVAAFLGADIVSGIVACNLDQSEENNLLIDLGTNGEIFFGNKNKMYTTSTAAGPAFEGVGMKCGGPSISGAITYVGYSDGMFKYETIGNTDPINICGSGIVSMIATLRRNGLIDGRGRSTTSTKEFFITEDISITEKDIQSFILAKAAIQTGLLLILDNKPVDKIYISGGLGTHLAVEDLILLRIIPQEYQNKIITVANSSLSGAIVALFNDDIERFDKIATNCYYIDLALHPDFEDALLDGFEI